MLEGPAGPVRGRAVQRRRIALLAILSAACGRLVGRERLIGLLWPEHRGDAARHLLSEALYVLRKTLGEEAFVSLGDEVGLNTGVVISDARQFTEAMDRGEWDYAVELYQGPFLDGFYLSEAPEFERWVDGERDRLASSFGDALERLAEVGEAKGDFLRAAIWWKRLSAHDPYSSRIVLRLMRALEHGGEHLAALRAATEHTDLLREDIGAAPDPAVLAYAERLRVNPPPSQLPPPPPPTAVPLPPSYASDDALLADVEPHSTFVSPPTHTIEIAETVAVPEREPVESILPLRMVTVAVVLMLMVIALAVVRAGANTSREAVSSQSPFPLQNVAVLYFEDYTEGGNLGYLARGLTERLVDDLARVDALRVTSTNGVRPFRNADVSPDSIAQMLQVGTLVTGSLHGSMRDLRVTIRLVDPSTGRLIATRTMRGNTNDLLSFEAWVSEVAAAFLRPRIGSEIRLQQRTAGTHNVKAKTLYLRGEEQWENARRMMTGANPLGDGVRQRKLIAADSLFADAARRDYHWSAPLVLRGWVALALWEGATNSRRRLAHLQDALRYADAALDRQPGDPTALELRGTVRWRMIHRGPLPPEVRTDTLAARAEEDLRNALEADSSLARGWATLAQVLRVQEGQLAAAEDAARRALQADAFLEEGPFVVDRLYRASLDLARYDSAAAWCSEGHRRFPNDWRFLECRLTLLGRDAGAPPKLDDAWHLYRELGQLDPPQAARSANRPYSHLYRRMAVARVAARAGLTDSARALIRASRREAGTDSTLVVSLAYDEAAVRFLLGETDRVFSLLEEYLRARPDHRKLIANDLTFEPLRTHPRYRSLVEQPPTRSAGTPARRPMSGFP